MIDIKKIKDIYADFLDSLSNSSQTVLLTSEDEILVKNISLLLACKWCENLKGAEKKILNGNAIDVVVLPKEKNFVVESANLVIENLYALPLELPYKIFIINDIDNATIQAQNKLLKSLEEPPSYVKFILNAKNKKGVLQTVISRAQVSAVPLLGSENLSKFFEFENPNQKIIADFTNGNISQFEKYVKNDNFTDLFFVVLDMFGNMKSSSEMLSYSSKLIKFKDLISDFVNISSSIMIDLACILEGDKNLVKNKHILSRLEVISKDYSLLSITKILEVINKIPEKLKLNCGVQGLIDELLLYILEVKHECRLLK